ncbi:MAG TPA: fibronectin type III domain-containing protein [Chthoniobacterales bacterium]|nr:fibronectin type III domain-containing protein [Chthoniobacterales bacterium]
MATNRIPQTYDRIVRMLEDAADGAHDHGAAIGLKQNTEAAIRADLEALAGKPAGPGNVPPATPGLKDKWNTARAAKTAATIAFGAVKQNGRALARACIGVLKPRLGDQWNSQWQMAGFANNSLAVPDNPMTMLQQFRSYFSANPTHEVASLNATSAHCHTAAEGISDAATASNASNVAYGNAKTAFAAGMEAGRTRLTGLRDELAQLLEDDDPLWHAFGFNMPSEQDTPEVPENLVATPGPAGSHTMYFDWDDAVRADSYRIIITNTATPPVELKNEIIHSESEVTYTDLPPGPIRATVSSRNSDGGESAPSDPVDGTVP